MYVFITARTFWDFTNTYIFKKPGTSYLNFSSFSLKQWEKGKTLTENYIPFHSILDIIKPSIS